MDKTLLSSAGGTAIALLTLVAVAAPASAASSKPRVRDVERVVRVEDRFANFAFEYRCTDPSTRYYAQVKQEDSRGAVTALYDTNHKFVNDLPALVCDGQTRSIDPAAVPVGGGFGSIDIPDEGDYGDLAYGRAELTIRLTTGDPADPDQVTERTRRVEVAGRPD
jgi:hypothetical protein